MGNLFSIEEENKTKKILLERIMKERGNNIVLYIVLIHVISPLVVLRLFP